MLLSEWLEDYAEAQKKRKKRPPLKLKNRSTHEAPKVTIPVDKLNIAINEFLLSLAEDSQRADMHINLGMAFEFKKSEEQALAEYGVAIELTEQQPQLKFIALFNKARLLAQMKNIPEALRFYQEALKINPDSIEVKTNIELLWQQQDGGGGGESDEQNNDDENNDENKDQKDPSDGDQDQKQKPKPKDLSEQDVKRILEEIKSQEQKIRAKEQELGGKERSREKDW
ncbi:MAG: tetratricopeptide repeat protein [Bdellovibrionales bacterium]